MPRRVELLPRAERELSAFRVSVQDQILAKLEMLRELPEMGAPMVDAYQGYRSLLAVRRGYRIVYRVVSDDLVEIAYIRHCARQIGLRALRGAGGGAGGSFLTSASPPNAPSLRQPQRHRGRHRPSRRSSG